MGRFLTPSKITLLVLAYVYAEGDVPPTETIHVLSFLVNHVFPDIGKSSTNLETLGITLPISVFEKHLSSRDSTVPGFSLWDLLLKKLWEIDCLAALDAFIDEILYLIAKTRLQLLEERDSVVEESELPPGKILKSSPLGIFIRRCYLEYTRLQFHDSIALWQDLITYRQSTRTVYEEKNDTEGQNELDINLSALSIDASHPLVSIMSKRLTLPDVQDRASYSTYDVERLFDFQVAELQQLGGRLPEDMRKILKQVCQKGAAIPKMACYLRCLDSWRAGDYASAFDDLHRFFDYSMQSRDRIRYQYALLNLAVLQADFGCHGEALAAMQEAIATARENRDTVCLNFCMSWLYYFTRSFPVQMKRLAENGVMGSEIESLAFLKSRAKDAEMWSMLSTALLCEAKLELQQGSSLAHIFENIVKANHITLIKTVPNAASAGLMMKCSVFGRVGQGHLAQVCGEILLQCHGSETPMDDLMKCYCRRASLFAQQGRYRESAAAIASISKDIRKVFKYQNYYTYFSGLLSLRRLLHWDDQGAAEQLLRKLKGQAPPDIESDFTLRILEIDLCTRKGNLEAALQIIRELADRVQLENDDIMIKTKLMILKAELWSKSGHTMRGFSLVVRAVKMACDARLLPILWEAVGALVNILIEVQEFQAAMKLMESVMPQIWESQDCELIARSYSLLVDINMGLAGLEEENSTGREDLLTRAIRLIHIAFEQYRTIEDLRGQLEMLSKKGSIHHFQGQLVLAEKTGNQYKKIQKAFADLRG